MEQGVENPPATPRSSEAATPFSAADTAERAAAPRAAAARRECPFCREGVHPEARKCPHCQEYLDPALAAERTPLPPVSTVAKASLLLAVLSPLFFFVPGPLAALLGLAGLLRRRRPPTRGTALALLGFLLGLLWTAVLIVAVLKMRGYTPPSEALPLF